MSLEQNNTVGDFETMLRRHLRDAGQRAAPCTEFDPEAASAYLEGAMSSHLRAGYESHLSSCGGCRHAVVLLQSLAPPAVVTVSAESSVSAWWSTLRESIFSPAWGLGLAATAGAVVLVFVVYSLRQPAPAGLNSSPVAMASPEPAASQAVTVAEAVPTSSGVIRPERREEVASRTRVAGAAQKDMPILGAGTPPAGLVQPPSAPKPAGVNEEVKAVQSPVTETQTVAQADARVQSEARKEEQRLDTLRAPSPSQVAQTQERPINDRGASRLAPREAAAKAKPQATPARRSNDDENFQPLMRRVRDKSFRFDRGVWIDQEYKPETRLQKTRLTHGTPEFERALSDNPSLAPFFDLGAVIVVWQGRVYEVRK